MINAITESVNENESNDVVNESSYENECVFMVYLNGDNDLYPYALQELNALMDVNSSNPLIVLFDGKYHGDLSLYIILNDNVSAMSLNEVDMENKNTLAYLLDFSKTNYDRRHYMLEIWSHGNGWMGVSFDRESLDECNR